MNSLVFLKIFFFLLISNVSLAQEHNTRNTAQSQLKLNLIGTIIHSDPTQSIASISGGVYNPQEKIKTQAQVIQISRFETYVLNLQSKKIEYISVGPYISSKDTKGKNVFKEKRSEFHLKESFINKVTEDLSSFLKDAGTKIVKDSSGKTIGFKLIYIKKGSVFDGLGLDVGDILTDVNNNKLDSISSVIGIFNQLKGSSMISLNVIRGNKNKSLNYLIRK